MRKFIITGVAVAMLAVPSAAMADPVDPADGYIWNESALATDQGNTVAEYTSQITHNGRWVKSQIGLMSEHGRSGVVQWVHDMDGIGRK
jgi:hypothetical protein